MAGRRDTEGRSILRRALQPIEGNPDVFSSERSFAPPPGERLGPPDRPRGYYIDFSEKVTEPSWPPEWLPAEDEQLHISTVQWALGAFERFVAGEGDKWLEASRAAADHLVGLQITEGSREGAWLHWWGMKHTYRLDPPWTSSIAQGEGASLMVRLHLETGEEHYAESARRALIPMRTPTSRGGVLVELDGGIPFFEEYPTQSPSLVLNGDIFALWGFRDVAALGDEDAACWYERGIDALAAVIDSYDTGSWSLYDRFPHPVANVASGAYHLLHINLLTVLDRVSPRPEIAAARDRFEEYRRSRAARRSAGVRKVAFRLITPRNALLAHRLPWNTWARRRHGDQDLVVLCYHAVSEGWDSNLSVTPEQLRSQIEVLLDSGHRPATFSEGVLGTRREKTFAVTFDDAFESVARLAKPVLDELGVPGTVFVPTKFANRSGPLSWPGVDHLTSGRDRAEMQTMGWDELGQLADEGWEIGSHTHSHPRLTETDDANVMEELRRSRVECELRLGRPCVSVAYPYGAYDLRVMKLAARAGYATAAALPPPFADERVLAWPRIGVYSVDREWRLRLKISPLIRGVQRSRFGPLIRRVALRSARDPGKSS